MMLRDKKRTIRFESIQQPIPQALYRHFGLDAERFDTFMVLADGRAFLRWRGVCEAAKLLPSPWRWLGRLGRLVPLSVGDRIYDWVQRNRFRWFGASKDEPPVCPI
jgi:predicted DCC family thiol-disulfide oxidoreductase YuxK